MRNHCGDYRITNELLEHLEKTAGGVRWKMKVNESIVWSIRNGLITYTKMPDGEFLFEITDKGRSSSYAQKG